MYFPVKNIDELHNFTDEPALVQKHKNNLKITTHEKSNSNHSIGIVCSKY